MAQNEKPSEEEFGSDRTQRCVELMKPEIRKLLDLSLDDKIKKTKEILEETMKNYRNPGVGFSGGSDSLCMLHQVLQVKHDIPVLMVDTCYEFDETAAFVNKIREEWGLTSLTVVRTYPNRKEEFEKKYGMGTTEFTLAFNKANKIEPLLAGVKLLNLDAFLGGIRAVEHEERAKESIFSPRPNLVPQHMRVHPILFWKREDVKDYLTRFNLPHHPIYDKGYTSLGSTLDTSPNASPTMHERAGRGVARERAMKTLRDLGYN